MHPEANPLRGILLVIAATLLFAAADTLGKYLALLYAAPVILAVRYSVNLALVTPVMAPRHGLALFRTHRTALVMLRGLCLALASICKALRNPERKSTSF